MMKWIMVSSLALTHEFELAGDDLVQLRLVCRELEIKSKMQLIFGREVEVELFEDES